MRTAAPARQPSARRGVPPASPWSRRPEVSLSGRAGSSLLLALLLISFSSTASRADSPPDSGAAGEGPGPEEEREDPFSGVSLGPLRFSGDLSQKYRYRRSDGDTDQDVYGYANLDATYPARSEHPAPYKRLAFNLQASYNLDIDSFESAGGTSSFLPFTDTTNTFGDRFRGFVHSAYGTVEDLGFLSEVRLGRQSIYREEGVLFDGARIRTKRWKTLAFEAYGGIPAHLYESSATGDAFAGASIDTEPFPGLNIGADYFYLRDASKDFDDQEDHLYILRLRHYVSRALTLGGSASWVDTRDRRQSLDARFFWEDWGSVAHLRVVRQNAVVGFQTSEISPYLLIEGDYAPYYQYQLDLYQPLSEQLSLSAGLNLRHLEDPSDEGLYNHDFANLYASFDTVDLWPGGRASVRGDLWESDGDDIYGVGFEVEQEVRDLLRARVGTSYSLYRIDLFTGTERERDRVYYARLRWSLGARVTLDTDYQYERDSETEYHTVLSGLRLWF